MEYYYTGRENINEKEGMLTVKGQDSKHIAKVLRKKKGDILNITDGERNIYVSKIVQITKDSVVCGILERKHNLFEPVVNVRLYAAPLRNQDRFEFLVEKAVELGVNEIVPVITGNTVPTGLSANKTERLRKIAVHAMGQSQRCYLTRIADSVTFDEMLKMTAFFQNKVVFYEHQNTESVYVKKEGENDVCALIGPEGGFEESEIKQLKENNWLVCSLGERKMRAETAAIIGIYEIINK
ncbi:MAG: 16S rRNA (uracil(1498)-N(3))-methyltransferase [Bacteroidetes bacterium]|nr:16S rRNA (uracil(1498)-N(3))-methyltransferase [Bacteroidota bacterium]